MSDRKALVGIALILAVLVIVSVFPIQCNSKVAWLAKNQLHATKLTKIIREYANTNGIWPTSLHDLTPEFIDAEQLLELGFSDGKEPNLTEWIYSVPYEYPSIERVPMIIAPRQIEGKIVTGYSDGSFAEAQPP